MSDWRAIAAATQTLHNMLQPAVDRAIPGKVEFSFSPPQNTPQITGDAVVNLYMFQVYPNPDFRNRDLPTRTSDGSLVERPEFAIDLDYLISFYAGKDEPRDKLFTQKLLGAVVATLHAQPTPREDHLPPGVDHGGLREHDLLRFTPIRLTRDDMSKLWSVHYQVPYQLSVAYRCSLLLIEPMPVFDVVDRDKVVESWAPRPSLPQRGAAMSPQPGMPPELESITPQILAFEPGAEVTVRGRGLAGPAIAVQVGKSEAQVVSTGSSALVFRLPPDTPAGVQQVRVLLGPKDGARVDSNSLPLVIQPKIVGEPQVNERDIGGGKSVPIAMVEIAPIAQPGQKVEFLLNPLPPASREAPAYRCRAEEIRTARSLIEAPISGVKKGKYLMRVEVDGATSALTVGPEGRYDSPQWELV